MTLRTARKLFHFSLIPAMAFGLVCSTISSIGFSQIKFAQLPGSDSFRKALSIRRSVAEGGRIRDLKWAKDFSTISFSNEKGKQTIDLKSGQFIEAKEFEVWKPASPAVSAPRRKPVPRAQQRPEEPSNDGKWIAVYEDFNVKIKPAKPGDSDAEKTTQVTTAGNERVRFGTGCWVYGEELSQQTAMWWSPNDRYLAYYQIDEQHMRDYHLTLDNAKPYTSLLTVRYPKAGDANPKVAIHIYDRESGKKILADIQGEETQYLYDVRWTPDGSELLINRTNRHQDRLDVIAVNPLNGKSRVVVSEQQETWQENSPYLRFLEDGKRFIWETEKNGWRNFELRHIDGRKLNSLTEANGYPANRIVKVDEAAGWVYYSAYSAENPYNQQLHRVKLDGTKGQRLTLSPHNHLSFTISPDHQWLIASREMVDSPPETVMYNSNGEETLTLAEATISDENKKFVCSELFSFVANDGKTKIYGTLHKPIGFNPKKKYPLLIDVYGGPGSTGISTRFNPLNPYCEFGFCIAKIGNRGTVGRGKAFESASYLKLGQPDLQDQADGVKFLSKRSYIDGSRVGIYGHSYGGYMSALAVLKYPEVFHVAVSGAPVTKWENYDTIYTERYMRTPQENGVGYKTGSCMEYAEQLKGKLLLVHGLIDDNVHPANTWQLVNALHSANKRFDMQIYPGYKHGIGSTYSQIRWEFFCEHLKPTP